MMKAQSYCVMVSGVMIKVGVTLRSGAVFYKKMLQDVMIYGSEIWAITYSMMNVLDGFHRHISQRIAGIWHGTSGQRYGSGPPCRIPWILWYCVPCSSTSGFAKSPLSITSTQD